MSDARFGEIDGPVPIGQVVETLGREFPDITHSSLRFLEREGLLTATRTPGGHRLFTPADIERIRQIKTWQAQRLSLDDIRRRLARLDRLPAPTDLAESFLEMAIAGEGAAAYRLILEADDLGLQLARLFGDVLQPALTELGRRWQRGELLVAQEKEISELARDVIAELSLRHAHPAPTGPTLVAACVEGERHELGLRMVCGLLQAKGYAVHYLGADVAPRFLVEATRLHRPAAILLSAKLAPALTAVKDAVDVLRGDFASAPLPLIVLGGQVAIDQAMVLESWGVIPIREGHPVAALEAVVALLAADPAATATTPEG